MDRTDAELSRRDEFTTIRSEGAGLPTVMYILGSCSCFMIDFDWPNSLYRLYEYDLYPNNTVPLILKI